MCVLKKTCRTNCGEIKRTGKMLSSFQALATLFLADPSLASGVDAVPVHCGKHLVRVCIEQSYEAIKLKDAYEIRVVRIVCSLQ